MAGTDRRRSNDIGRWLGMQKSGEWRFKMSAKKYAKCVDVSEGDTISDVERKIATTLGVEGKRTKRELKEDNEDVSKTKGQCESRGPDVIVVRVVAKEEDFLEESLKRKAALMEKGKQSGDEKKNWSKHLTQIVEDGHLTEKTKC
ncbi:unnamed protein product [Arabidopsis thaliana]|uniref:Uncharacterized protein n=1 Tax=Arabidopsis thaliana TaxID=3702 RepID=A0A5S9WXN8_ARATH|nr:unnamed protein product [Arabidopsis thaliana]